MHNLSCAVRTAALAFVFVNVDPAAFKAVLALLPYSFSGSSGHQHFLLRFFKWNLHIRIRNEGGVKIVHMKLIRLHQLFAQTHITVQDADVLMNGFDQVMMNFTGTLVASSEAAGRRIFARLCKKISAG